MYAKVKKGNRFSEVFPLNGLSPEEVLQEHDGDEIHLLTKNGYYSNLNGLPSQKWRTKEIIPNQQSTPMQEPTYRPPVPSHQNPTLPHHQPIHTPGHPPNLMMPSTIEAAQMHIMHLQNQVSELKSEKNRYKDKFEDYKTKFEKTDRDNFELKQNHREELRNLKDESEQGLNGFIDKNPAIAEKLIDVLGPALAGIATKKLGGSDSNQNQAIETDQDTRKELNEFITYAKSLDTQDPGFINTCIILAHVYTGDNPGYQEIQQIIHSKNPTNA